MVTYLTLIFLYYKFGALCYFLNVLVGYVTIYEPHFRIVNLSARKEALALKGLNITLVLLKKVDNLFAEIIF